MGAVERIKSKLARYPECRYHTTETSVETTPAIDGFSVGLRAIGQTFVVNFDGWHETFDARMRR